MLSLRRRVRELPWLLIFVLCNGFGVFLFIYRALDDVARQRPVDWLTRFVEEMTGAYSQLPLIPVVTLLAIGYPIAGNWRRLPVYLAAATVYGFLDTSLMYGLRLAMFGLLGKGLYDYGILPVRYFMELPFQLIMFAMIVLVATYSEQRRSARELERELVRAQLDTLRFQLQPHFLFNALNAISAVMYEDPKVADRMIGRLSEFLRRVLRSDGAQEVELREELELAHLYLDVMKARFEDKLRCAVSCKDEIETALVPQLILQPVVENAIRHGSNRETGDIDIRVEARRHENHLHIHVTDAGTGQLGQDQGGFGLGLKNIDARLDRLYGSEARLSIEPSETGGTRVLITLPFHREPLKAVP